LIKNKIEKWKNISCAPDDLTKALQISNHELSLQIHFCKDY